MRLSQKIKHGAVCIKAAKGIEVVDRFNRYVFRGAFIAVFVNRQKLEGIVFPAQAAGIEKVVGLFHIVWTGVWTGILFDYNDL